MNAALLLVISIVILVCGYIFYGGWLAKTWGIDPSKCFLSTVIPLKPHDNSLKSSWDIPPNSRTLL